MLFADARGGEARPAAVMQSVTILNTPGITVQFARADQHDGEQDTDQDPGTEKNLAMEVEIADLPVQMVPNLQFGERQCERQQSH